MKPTPLLLAIMLAVLTLDIAPGQVIPSGSDPFERIQFSLIVRQQDIPRFSSYLNNDWTAKTMRLGNKDILKLLAAAFHTEWPAGAHLGVYRYDWDEDVTFRYLYVLDKDGNPLWNCGEGYFVDETNNASFQIGSGSPVQNGWYKSKWGFMNQTLSNTCFQMMAFHLYRYDDTDPTAFTDLTLQGLDTEKYYSRHYTQKHFSYTRILDCAHLSGAGTVNGTWTVVSGSVTISKTSFIDDFLF